MERLFWFVFRAMCKRVVKKGDHVKKIRTAYKIIHDEAYKEFNEETWLTTDAFLQERFSEQCRDIGETYK